MYTDIKEEDVNVEIAEGSNPFLSNIKTEILSYQFLDETEKSLILSCLPNKEKIVDTVSLIKALGYNTYMKGHNPIVLETMRNISAQTRSSFIYLNSLGVNMSLIYSEYFFDAPLESVIPAVRILQSVGVSVEDAIRFHPELLSMDDSAILNYLNTETDKTILTTEEEDILTMLETRDPSRKHYLGPEIQNLLFNALLNTHKILFPEQELINVRKRIVNRLSDYNIPLVKNLVDLYIEKTDRPDFAKEFFSAGMVGLSQAIVRYDPRKGFKFSTYARFWIKSYLSICVKNEIQKQHLPQKKQALAVLYEDIEEELMREKKVNIVPQKEILNIMRQRIPNLCKEDDLLAAIAQNKAAFETFEDELINPHTPSPEHIFIKQQSHSIFEHNLQNILTPIEIYIILKRFPLSQDDFSLTQRELAGKLKLTHQRVTQIEQKALEKIRQSPKLLGLLQ